MGVVRLLCSRSGSQSIGNDPDCIAIPWHRGCVGNAPEGIVMTRGAFLMLFGAIGSGIGIWMWRRQFSVVPVTSRGTVIFRNTPTVSEGV